MSSCSSLSLCYSVASCSALLSFSALTYVHTLFNVYHFCSWFDFQHVNVFCMFFSHRYQFLIMFYITHYAVCSLYFCCQKNRVFIISSFAPVHHFSLFSYFSGFPTDRHFSSISLSNNFHNFYYFHYSCRHHFHYFFMSIMFTYVVVFINLHFSFCSFSSLL